MLAAPGAGTCAPGWEWRPPIEAPWPYAPVLEAVADLCRRHPALLDGLDDAFREEIERALSGRDLRGAEAAATSGCSWRSSNWCGWPPPGRARCWSSTTPTSADAESLRLLHYLSPEHRHRRRC